MKHLTLVSAQGDGDDGQRSPEHVAQMQASLIAQAIESCGVAMKTEAEYLAKAVVASQDQQLVEGARWRAAERMFAEFCPKGQQGERLMSQPVHADRQRWVRYAELAIAAYERCLEGVIPQQEVRMSAGEYRRHAEALKTSRETWLKTEW